MSAWDGPGAQTHPSSAAPAQRASGKNLNFLVLRVALRRLLPEGRTSITKWYTCREYFSAMTGEEQLLKMEESGLPSGTRQCSRLI